MVIITDVHETIGEGFKEMRGSDRSWHDASVRVVYPSCAVTDRRQTMEPDVTASEQRDARATSSR